MLIIDLPVSDVPSKVLAFLRHLRKAQLGILVLDWKCQEYACLESLIRLCQNLYVDLGVTSGFPFDLICPHFLYLKRLNIRHLLSSSKPGNILPSIRDSTMKTRRRLEVLEFESAGVYKSGALSFLRGMESLRVLRVIYGGSLDRYIIQEIFDDAAAKTLECFIWDTMRYAEHFDGDAYGKLSPFQL